MKIFGFEITRDKEVTGQRVTLVSAKPPKEEKKISSIKPITPVVLNYSMTAHRGRGAFQSPEFDISKVGKLEDVESMIRQSFKKKKGLMFKEGVGYSGKNKDTIKYVQTRMAQIARASNIPTIDLMKRVGESLIRVSNAFLIKKRDIEASGGKERVLPGTSRTIKPVAAYFPAAPETMQAEVDQSTGKITRWRQMLPTGFWKDFSVDDVIHFAVDKREGFLFGIPVTVPVEDDVRALRQIEENIEVLLYQHLFPLLHYTVGTETAPAGWTEDGYKEVDIVKSQIELMPQEGVIVTPERHSIEAIGSEGRALRAEGYLTHFKKRVISGLGVSSVDLGDGETVNKSTAFTLSRQLVDSVKDIQDSFESQWDQFVISELLLESTFSFDVLDEQNMVHLVFKEIDLQNRMELEKHATDLFKSNGITYDEFRAVLNKEPIAVPEDPENQDPSQNPEWFNTYWKLFDEPLNIIRAVDEPSTPQAKAAALMRSTAITQKGNQESIEEKKASEKEKVQQLAQQKPNNQQKDFIVRDNFIKQEYNSSFKELVLSESTKTISHGRSLSFNYLEALGNTWSNQVSGKLISMAHIELLNGFKKYTTQSELVSNPKVLSLLEIARNEIGDRINFVISKLKKDTIRLLKRKVDLSSSNDIIQLVHSVFNSLSYRADFIWDVEIRKARSYGELLGMKLMDVKNFEYEVSDNSCKECQALKGKVFNINNINLDDAPPLHPHSKLKVKQGE